MKTQYCKCKEPHLLGSAAVTCFACDLRVDKSKLEKHREKVKRIMEERKIKKQSKQQS